MITILNVVSLQYIIFNESQVLEEVSEEIHNLKMETLAETTSKFVEKSSKYGKRFKVTIGPNAGKYRKPKFAV